MKIETYLASISDKMDVPDGFRFNPYLATDYAKMLACLDERHVNPTTCKILEVMNNEQYEMAVNEIVSEGKNVLKWSPDCRRKFFDFFLRYSDCDPKNFVIPCFIEKYLDKLVASDPEHCFETCLQYLEQKCGQFQYYLANVGSIANYREEIPVDRYPGYNQKYLLLSALTQSILHLDSVTKAVFVERKANGSDLHNRITAMIITTEPELYSYLMENFQTLIGDLRTYSEYYNGFSRGLGEITAEQIDSLVNSILTCDFGNYGMDDADIPRLRYCLLCPLRSKSRKADDFCIMNQEFQKEIDKKWPYKISRMFEISEASFGGSDD